MAELAKSSIKPRHWTEVKTVTNCPLKIDTEEIFYLSNLLEANLLEYRDDIEEITESADKQLKIEQNLKEITETWADYSFEFEGLRNRDAMCRLVGSKV
jgi:dynein heavy chain